MTRRLVLCSIGAAFCALALIACGGDADEAASAEPPAWNHDPTDTELGPTAWDEVDSSFDECGSGDSQSPVDLPPPASSALPELELTYGATPLVVENTGHTIEVPLPESVEDTLTIGEEEYRLVQFHFHAPSEHTLAGESFDAEVHLVHESEEGDLAVVGILLRRSDDEPVALVDQVLENAPVAAGQEVEVETEVNPLDLLPVRDPSPALVGSYYGYPGSLTTPGCTEGVRWFVLHGPSAISSAALGRLHELIAGFPEYDGYENNNRPTQPLNEREVDGAAG